MTKHAREAAEREAEERAVRVRLALRWTAPAALPDVPPPDNGSYGTLTTGYMWNIGYRTVNEGCSSSTGHAYGRTDRATSQRPAALYSTRLLALLALRAVLEQEFAGELANIDVQISVEENNGRE